MTIDIAPTAAFTAPASAKATGSPVSFDATASTAMTGGLDRRLQWNFGDGTPVDDTGATATDTHAYAQPATTRSR